MLASMAYASVIPRPSTHFIPRAAAKTAVDQLLELAPTSNTCDGAAHPDECATNVQAAPYLIDAMSKYKIFSVPEIAAVLSLIVLESGDFKFNRNYFPEPGQPGQGLSPSISHFP